MEIAEGVLGLGRLYSPLRADHFGGGGGVWAQILASIIYYLFIIYSFYRQNEHYIFILKAKFILTQFGIFFFFFFCLLIF